MAEYHEAKAAKKLVNKKITDSLQSKKRVSTASHFNRSFKENKALSNLELPPSTGENHTNEPRRSIHELFTEFNLTECSKNQSLDLSSKNPFLTPVQEEIESNPSSAEIFNKSLEEEKLKNRENRTMNYPVRESRDLSYWENKLNSDRKDLVRFENECNRILAMAECLQIKHDMLVEEKKDEIGSVFSQSFFSCADFSKQEFRFEDRWVHTWTKLIGEGKIEYFRHKACAGSDWIMSKLVLAIFVSDRNKVSLNLELFKRFCCDDIEKIWSGYKNYVMNLMKSLPKHEIFEKTSFFWVSFLDFSSKFDMLFKAIEYNRLEVLDRSFVLNGKMLDKSWKFTCTYYDIIEGVNIFQEILKFLSL